MNKLSLLLLCSTLTGAHLRAEPTPELTTSGQVTVHFRRDAVGAAAIIDIGDMMKASKISGQVATVNGGWVVKTGDHTAWIPNHAILFIESSPDQKR